MTNYYAILFFFSVVTGSTDGIGKAYAKEVCKQKNVFLDTHDIAK